MASGDPRVHLVMNAVLSAVYATLALWALDFAGVATFTLENAAVATVVIFALTYLVVLR